MADLPITSENVKPAGTNAILKAVLLGETVTAGETGYENSSDGKFYKGDADDATDTRGVFVLGGSTDTYGIIQTGGDITIGATVTVGETYVTSATEGKICPRADLTTGDRINILGIAKSTSVIALRVNATGVTVP